MEHAPAVREQVPIVASPFSILTEPVGVPLDPETVAVMVTVAPKLEGDGEVVMTTVGVGLGATT